MPNELLFKSHYIFPKNLDKIKGELYKRAEDFIVREIHKDGKVCSIEKEKKTFKEGFQIYSKPYVYATMVKENISTFEACNIFVRKNNLDYNDISFCGLKDTFGLTSQLICIKNNPNLKIKHVKFKNFFLKDFKPSNKKLNVNNHKGNNFIIKVRNVSSPKENIKKILNNFKIFAARKGLPNFYDLQRFGIRQNNHFFGKLLLKKRYEDFLFHFLTYSKNENPSVMRMRKKIKDNFGYWKKCFDIIKNSKKLLDEKTLICNLSKNNDYLIAIKSIELFSFFIHGYSSYLFNLALASFLEKNYENVKLEKIGTNTKFDKFNKSLFDPILKKEGVSLKDFKKCDFNIEGHPRDSLFYPKNFEFYIKSKAINLTFNLGKGEYASLVLDHLIESNVMKLN